MKIITDDLPKGVFGDGVYYPVRTDFRVWLKFAQLLEDLTPENVARAFAACYTKIMPQNPEKALSLLCEFFSGGEVSKTKNKNGKQLISFAKDEELIYASFLMQYKIDLTDAQMHWWKFLALFRNLGKDTPIMQVATLRNTNPAEIKDSKIRRRVIEQKRIFSIDENAEVDVAEALSALF